MARVVFWSKQERPRMKTVWVMMVLVLADGEWREWEHHYARLEECQEAKELLTYRRENILIIRCEPRQIKINYDR